MLRWLDARVSKIPCGLVPNREILSEQARRVKAWLVKEVIHGHVGHG